MTFTNRPRPNTVAIEYWGIYTYIDTDIEEVDE